MKNPIVEVKVKSKIIGAFIFCVLTMGTPLHSLDSFGSFFSISSQPLNLNDPVKFDLDNSEKNMGISSDRKTVIIHRQGQYLITFTATGSLSSSGTQEVGPWSLGLYRNGGLIVGTVAGSTSGTDAEDTLDARTIVGQTIISAIVGDQLQVRSTTTLPISIIGTVSGGPHQNTSVSMNVVQIE